MPLHAAACSCHSLDETLCVLCAFYQCVYAAGTLLDPFRDGDTRKSMFNVCKVLSNSQYVPETILRVQQPVLADLSFSLHVSAVRAT